MDDEILELDLRHLLSLDDEFPMFDDRNRKGVDDVWRNYERSPLYTRLPEPVKL